MFSSSQDYSRAAECRLPAGRQRILAYKEVDGSEARLHIGRNTTTDLTSTLEIEAATVAFGLRVQRPEFIRDKRNISR